MSVAFDVATESHTGTTGSTSEGFFTWTHTTAAGVTPQGVVVFVFNANSLGADANSVTYASIDVPAVVGGLASDTAGEPGSCKAFFLGTGLPSGNQTVQVNRNNNANIMYAVSCTVLALCDTQVWLPGIVLLQEDGTVAGQSVDDGSPGTNSLRFAGDYTGNNSPLTAAVGSTTVQSIDLTSFACAVCRENTAGQGARTVGYDSGVGSDDRAAVHLAIREVAHMSQATFHAATPVL